MNAQNAIADFLPSSIEAEQGILGAVLLQNDVFFSIAEILQAEMFYEGLHQQIWSVLETQITAGNAITPLTLAASIGKDASALIDGSLTVGKYVARLAAEGASVYTAPEYAKTIRDLWSRRRLIGLSREMIQRAAGGFSDEGIDVILDEADAELGAIRFGKQINGVRSIGEFADVSLKQTAEAYQNEAKVGFDTRIEAIDVHTGPMLPGDLVTIIGPSGGGKSALAAQILANNCERSLDTNRGVPALYVSLEMTGAQLARRALATHTGIAPLHQKSGSIVAADFEFLRGGAEALRSVPLYIDESHRQTTARIIRKLRAMNKRYGIKIAAIDHLKLIRPEHYRMSDLDTIKHAAMEFKDAAVDLGMVIILLAQVTRESMKREGIRVRASDLFGGEVVKECSDIVVTVSLPRKTLLEREPGKDDRSRGQWEADCLRWEGRAEIGLPKIRDGDDGFYTAVAFDGPKARFSDL